MWDDRQSLWRNQNAKFLSTLAKCNKLTYLCFYFDRTWSLWTIQSAIWLYTIVHKIYIWYFLKVGCLFEIGSIFWPFYSVLHLFNTVRRFFPGTIYERSTNALCWDFLIVYRHTVQNMSSWTDNSKIQLNF